ncbi:MAG: GerMN domain-containing protein, partial [Clostridia bacterium]
MDLKKFIIIFIIILVIIAIGASIYFFVWYPKAEEITEYVPEEEISEEQMRQTMVSLYFKNGKEVVPEARLIDVKQLLENPYTEILEMLIKGPKNEKLEKTIPEGTKINKVEKQGENLIIDFSEEFINHSIGGEEEENITIKSIVNTVTELTEINGVKIKINGEENKAFKDEKIN